MKRLICAALIALQLAAPALAWNAHGHRTITYLALDGLPSEAPEWLRDATVRHRIAFQSSEPDRWRSSGMSQLHHENKPDHFIDIEDLAQFGLTLETIPPLRNEYRRAMAIAKHIHPDQMQKYDAAKDADRAQEFPGDALHAIAEHYAKLQSAFSQVRILERVNDPDRAFQLQQCRENAIYHMGVLSHFVGDLAQPLHTTRHYNGWVGENPSGYTESKKFHSYIDGGVLDKHSLTFTNVKPAMRKDAKIENPRDPWKEVLTYVRRSHDRMEPLYAMEKSGELDKDAGKQFITACLADGASMLSAMYWAAWNSAVPNDKQVADFVFFDELKPELLPGK
ncbi:MAG: S1/P1 nuclease [Phycisphaerae bacterium]